MQNKQFLAKADNELEALYQDIAAYVHGARENVIRSVNYEMVNAYWHIGKRIVEVEQRGEKRAQYGENLLNQLSSRLTKDFGKGFGVTNLKYFRQFYLTYHDRIGHKAGDESCDLLNSQLSWSHYRALINLPGLMPGVFSNVLSKPTNLCK